MNEDQKQLITSKSAVDLFAPAARRFESTARLYGGLHRWWLLFRKNWKLLGLIFLAVVVPVCGLTVLSGTTYESRARMWVPGKIAVSESWTYTEELVNFLGTQAELLQSPTIQGRAVVRLEGESKPGNGLNNSKGKAPGNFLSKYRTWLHQLMASSSAPDNNAPPPVPYRVKVLQGAKSSTLELQATGHDPRATREFLNCLMAEYLSFKRESRDQASTQASSSLTAGEIQLKSDLAAAQDKLQAFQASNNVALLQQQGSGAENYLGSLNHQLAVLRTEEKLLESLKPDEWVQSSISQAGTDQPAGNEAEARQLLSGLAESQSTLFQADQQMHVLMAKRTDLSRFLRPAHPKIIKLDQDIATQQEIVQAARDEAAKQLASRRESLQAQITNLEAACNEWNAKAIETTRKVAEYDQLQQNIQRLQGAYDKTFGLIQNMDVASRVEQESMAVLEPASLARATHRLFINTSVATFVALLFCLALLYGLSLFHDSFASQAELVEHLAAPVVGQIPHISIKYHLTPLGIEELEKQRFEFMEAFRNLRASLLLMNNGEPRPKTVVITSSVPEEGKSTVSLYLAATLARANSRVLLIDADMRRPSLHKKFGLPSGPGLAEMLSGDIPFVDLKFPEGIENLAFLPAGEARQNPGELALSPVWTQFLASVESQFDFIVLDTPPVAATDEAAVLAPRVDGVLFVVRAMSTSARVARSALNILRQRHVRLLGLIFNQAVSSPCERQYYQPYAGDYQWKPTQHETASQIASSPVKKKEAKSMHSGKFNMGIVPSDYIISKIASAGRERLAPMLGSNMGRLGLGMFFRISYVTQFVRKQVLEAYDSSPLAKKVKQAVEARWRKLAAGIGTAISAISTNPSGWLGHFSPSPSGQPGASQKSPPLQKPAPGTRDFISLVNRVKQTIGIPARKTAMAAEASSSAVSPISAASAPASSGRFGLNMASNLGQLGLSIIVGAWYVPFLVRKLGPAAYGLIPLASTITSYMALITLGLNSAVGRYLTIALEHGDSVKANRIFNTSFWGSLALTAILSVPVIFGVIFVDSIIRVPPGFVSQTRWLFAMAAAAFLLNEIKTPFDVSSFCRNRFDLRNLVAISEVLARVGMVVILFYGIAPDVSSVGSAIFFGTVVSTTGALVLWKTLTPTLHVSLRDFDWNILRELTGTGGWVIVNQIGAILYLSIDLLVANRLFGAEQGGRYAAVLALPMLIRTVGSTIGGVFSPTVLYYYARQDLDGMMSYLSRAVKCLGLMLALPIALTCGFAEPLLRLWLGPAFSNLYPLLLLMTAHLCINLPILPLLGMQLATNRVKVPAQVTIVMGVANLGLALLLAGPMHWNLYGIAAAGGIMLTIKNVFFTPIYGAHVLGKECGVFFRELAIIVGVTAATFAVCRGLLWFQPIAGWSQLIVASLGVCALYGLVVHQFILTVEERQLVRKLVPFFKS